MVPVFDCQSPSEKELRNFSHLVSIPSRKRPSRRLMSGCVPAGIVRKSLKLHISFSDGLSEETQLYRGSAYQGYDTGHADIDCSCKKPKVGDLNADEKEYNAGLSRFRVKVEQRIGRCKRLRTLSDRFRNPPDTHHTRASILVGMANMNTVFPAGLVNGKGESAAVMR